MPRTFVLALAFLASTACGESHAAVGGTASLKTLPLTAAPEISDYEPDHGVPGDSIRILGNNLLDADLEVFDVRGTRLQLSALGCARWLQVECMEAVQVTLPSTVVSGPLSVRSPVGADRGRYFNVGENLAHGATLTSSSEYSAIQWARAQGADNQLATSFFTAQGDAQNAEPANGPPWFKLAFATPQRVGRIAIRGNREFDTGFDFLRVKFEVLGEADAPLWEGSFDLPEPNRDLDVLMPAPLDGARAVRMTSLADEGVDPGFAELEVFAR